MAKSLLEAKVNQFTDAELIEEIAAVYEESRAVKEAQAADSAVQEAITALEEAKAPFVGRISYLKKYAKALINIAKLRELKLVTREIE